MELDITMVDPNVITQPIDVIVPTHNTKENRGLGLTISAVEALYANTRAPFQLIVVDDSTDVTPAVFGQFCEQHDNITFIHSDEPYKSGNQIFNIGLEHCRANYVATIMNSIRVEPDWEVVALELMGKNPKIGIIGFKCLFPWGLIESAGINMAGSTPVDMGRDMPSHRLAVVYPAPAVQWAFALLRKEAVVGNLAEDVFHGFKGWDDIDNCFVVRDKGWQIYYCGLGVGYHDPRATRGSNTSESFQQNKENGEAFRKRWGFWEAYLKANPTEAPSKRRKNK